MDNLYIICLGVVFTVCCMVVMDYYIRKKRRQNYEQRALKLYHCIYEHKQQIQTRQSNLTAYNFSAYNLKEVLVPQTLVLC